VISSKVEILPAEVENIVVLAGQGIKAKINGKLMVIGNRVLLSEYVDVTEVDVAIGKSTVYCYLEGLGYLVLIVEDKIRKDAKDVVTNMLNSRLDVTLLSGDKKEIAENTANTLGIRNCLYEVKPDEKEASIQSLQKQGGLIAMVGDGINDAPALVRADVGIAMDSGTDISIDSADIVLLDGQLNKIPLASALSKRTLLTIKQNIGLSIVYNVVMVPLAMMAMITPLVAAIAMPISSLLVIANASRIHLYFSKNKRG
jgi:Cu2+-exporting ATPase